ncbi:MAG: glycosyltransferase [Verrucomicrobia bacterium]|nr:glycosyltransferase [Verrucomicrobiota bacterium]
MRSIHVCSAGFGEGHNSAARALVAAFERLQPAELQAEFLDLNARVQPERDALMRRIYLQLLSHAPRVWAGIYRLIDRTRWVESFSFFNAPLRAGLAEVFREKPPAALVSAFPFYGVLLDEMEERGFRRDFPRLTIVTDSISINSIWFRFRNDLYFVPNDDTARVMVEKGVPAEKLRVTGFPVHPRFADGFPPRPDVLDPAKGRRALYIVNSRAHEAPDLVRALLEEVPGLRLTVTAGRDEKLHARLEELARRPQRNGSQLVRVLGWTREIPELLASHHLVISKAGGATVQEAIAAGCPMVMCQVAPGQEEGNATLLTQNGAGVVAPTRTDVVRTVRDALAGDASIQRGWATNIARLSRPRAALELAEFVLEEIARWDVRRAAATPASAPSAHPAVPGRR